MASIINSTTTAGVTVTGDNSGSLQLATNNGTTAVTIDTSQNVGIGTTSPSSFASTTNLALGTGSSGAALTVFTGTAQTGAVYFADGTTSADRYRGAVEYSHGNNALAFTTDASERMRIDSSGNVGIGTTNPSQKLHVDGGSGMSASALIARFFGTSGQSMLIRGNGNLENSLGSYGTISDAKLKENIVDATPKLDDINKLKVRNYNLIGNDLKQIGFVAQEIEQVFPNIVSESPDIDENGNDLGTTTKTVKTSVLIPILVKAMQELKAELDATKAEVQALKGTL